MKKVVRNGVISLIRIYKRFISPVKMALFGPYAGCRFYPTCADYAISAIKKHGIGKGLFISMIRICKCHPFSRGGFDPVPDKLIKKPFC